MSATGLAAASMALQAITSALAAKKEKKAGKMRSKEMERDTKADLLNEAQERESELQTHKLKSNLNAAGRKARSFRETSDLVRGATKI
jgi:hypothetical protein